MKKRSEFEMLSDVLQVAKDGAKKSHIVYKANLNFALIRKILKTLIANNFLVQEGGLFKTTTKGFDYIKNVACIESMLEGKDSWKKYCTVHPNEELMFGCVCSECAKEYNRIICESRDGTPEVFQKVTVPLEV